MITHAEIYRSTHLSSLRTIIWSNSKKSNLFASSPKGLGRLCPKITLKTPHLCDRISFYVDQSASEFDTNSRSRFYSVSTSRHTAKLLCHTRRRTLKDIHNIPYDWMSILPRANHNDQDNCELQQTAVSGHFPCGLECFISLDLGWEMPKTSQ